MFDIFFKLWFWITLNHHLGELCSTKNFKTRYFKSSKHWEPKAQLHCKRLLICKCGLLSKMMPAKCAFFHPRSWPIPANAGLVLHLILLEYSLAALPVKVFLPNPMINSTCSMISIINYERKTEKPNTQDSANQTSPCHILHLVAAWKHYAWNLASYFCPHHSQIANGHLVAAPKVKKAILCICGVFASEEKLQCTCDVPLSCDFWFIFLETMSWYRS